MFSNVSTYIYKFPESRFNVNEIVAISDLGNVNATPQWINFPTVASVASGV